ncbi:hypothetical protein [Nostoc sp. MS1]|uniref:hypothetical protein n=1 Tax=Nostoc sp. MS1 TaxID=2764711 RepID=UPI001CC6D2C3|nr:hypothetical protein [Nostoc sp. MS1]BCL36893.1 hypothetical protein NSMS1_33400 [Nostoc sp. MS1]
MLQEVTTWYLEMLDPNQLHPSAPGDDELPSEQAKSTSQSLILSYICLIYHKCIFILYAVQIEAFIIFGEV